mgnify:CR=1 FL=1
MIEVQNVHKTFGKMHALWNVSFQAHCGDVLGLVGPNGAGKTTLMRILGCYMPPTQGVIRINSMDPATHSLKIRQDLGYFQERISIYPEMRVFDFLHFMSKLKNVPKGQRKERIAQAMHTCSLEQVTHRIIGTLSKGYQQRVGLAQAFLNNPKILLLDEPTAGLDPVQANEIRKIIKELGSQCTVILSSHILSEISILCNKILILDNGQVTASYSSDELKKLLYSGKNKYVIHIQAPDHAQVISTLINSKGVRSVQKMEGDDPFDNHNIVVYLIDIDDINLCDLFCSSDWSNEWTVKQAHYHALNFEDLFIKFISRGKSS